MGGLAPSMSLSFMEALHLCHRQARGSSSQTRVVYNLPDSAIQCLGNPDERIDRRVLFSALNSPHKIAMAVHDLSELLLCHLQRLASAPDRLPQFDSVLGNASFHLARPS